MIRTYKKVCICSLLILLTIFAICNGNIYSYAKNEEIPSIGLSSELTEDEHAMNTLKDLIDDYREIRNQKLEDRDSYLFTQDAWDAFYNFAVEYKGTDSALTATLIIAELLMTDSSEWLPDDIEAINSYLSNNYLERWQGAKAAANLLGFRFRDLPLDEMTQEQLQMLQEHSKSMLPRSEYLDESNRPDIRAYSQLYNFPWVAGNLESIARYSRKLGEYNTARESYEEVIRRYPGTIMELRAQQNLFQLDKELSESHISKDETVDSQKTESPKIQTPLPMREAVTENAGAVILGDAVLPGVNTLIDLSEDSNNKATNYGIIIAAILVVLGVVAFTLLKRCVFRLIAPPGNSRDIM